MWLSVQEGSFLVKFHLDGAKSFELCVIRCITQRANATAVVDDQLGKAQLQFSMLQLQQPLCARFLALLFLQERIDTGLMLPLLVLQ
eukprot:Skav224582  [mRNA]  locus=scaffold246:227989:229476:+ [translate_table: standard]